MTRQLILFIQSDNPGLYTNILTHCVQSENVRSIYFAINSGSVGSISEEINKIGKIRDKFDNLVSKYPDKYKQACEMMPSFSQLDERIVRVPFTNPEFSINDLKRKFHDVENLIVDVSGCNKKVSSDIISSYMLNGIRHICCFELDNSVYSPEWKQQGLSRDYHDICREISYYEYVDFSSAGTTIKSFNRMRSQGQKVKLLSMVSIMLGIIVLILIQQQQNVSAQYATVALTLVAILGGINDIFGIVERLR
ncbi:MAG: hypothetical protein J0L70_02880 [Leptolyngbya sp. UWPOB_LEPTO1]|uniref:hypothetical protein n=1 Tax=Leptolyngbya sp. UWPOB_LEPTO1 TaxID=2815653 RepID=UPI001AC3C027|nr:hypothetical protein [Leptolyngbya sp. UWPOB_LEPTO1]MBN8559448.1 hypothetical protein [Leptolyngbya sp. UWPOB_LEPTO1]